jgi:predicted amidohydrolase
MQVIMPRVTWGVLVLQLLCGVIPGTAATSVPSLTVTDLSNGVVHLQISNLLAGLTYSLEGAPSLSPAVPWTNIVTWPADASKRSWSESVLAQSDSFYRLRLQETVTVRVALCQLRVTDGNVQGNLAKIESQVKQAAAEGARVCVFPELADVGFGSIVKASTGAEKARPIPGETTEALGRMAIASQVWIAIALLEQVPKGVCDTCVLIDARGTVVLRQRKAVVYPVFGGAKAYEGNYHDAELVNSPWGWIGMMNCADTDAKAKRGVLTALKPSLMLVTLANGNASVLDNCPKLASEGQCPVVGVNQVFPGEGGKSRVCLPNGKTVYQAGLTELVKVVEISTVPPANRPPVLDAGDVQTIQWPAKDALLVGDASDDGRPDGSLIATWSKVTGPGEVIFEDASALQTKATFSEPGVYLMRLTATDGALSSESRTWINVLPGGGLDLQLMGHWHFDGTPNDSSGKGNHGTFVGNATYSDDLPPGASPGSQSLDLDGHTAYVSVNHNPSLSAPDAVTICLWIKPRSYPGFFPTGNDWSSLVHKGDQWGSQNYLLGFGAYFYLHSDSLGMRIPSLDDAVRTPNQWYHVAAVIDAKRNCGKIYVNGVRDHTVFNVGSYIPNSDPLFIGSSRVNPTSINGILDDVRLYRRALSDSEIAALVPGALINQSPLLDAGTEPVPTASPKVKLSGRMHDDGHPASSQVAQWTAWSKVSGPGDARFANRYALDSEVELSEPGDYVLQLTGSDGAHRVNARVEVHYRP